MLLRTVAFACTTFSLRPGMAYASNETGSMEIYVSRFRVATASGRCRPQEDRAEMAPGRQSCSTYRRKER